MDTPEKAVENKKALKIFGIEAAAILILILVIIGILAFLGVFSFSPISQLIPKGGTPTPTFSPDAKAYFESQRKIQLQQIEQRKPDTTLPKNISIVSDVPSVNASITDKQGLIDLITSWEVYGRLYDSNSGLAKGSMNGKRLENLTINLVTEPQVANRYVNGDDVYSSSSVDLNSGKMTVNIQIDSGSPDLYAQQVMFQLVTMLTNMTNPVNSEAEKASRQKIIDDRYAELREKSGDYFVF